MEEKRGMKRVDLGPTGQYTAARIAEVRAARGLTYQGLSDRLRDAHWSIPELGLRRIEAQARRVTVDDLMAIAAALNVSPLELLIPTATTSLPLPTGVPESLSLDEAWEWAKENVTLSRSDRLRHWLYVVDETTEKLAEIAELKLPSRSSYAKVVEHDRRRLEALLRRARERVDVLSHG